MKLSVFLTVLPVALLYLANFADHKLHPDQWFTAPTEFLLYLATILAFVGCLIRWIYQFIELSE